MPFGKTIRNTSGGEQKSKTIIALTFGNFLSNTLTLSRGTAQSAKNWRHERRCNKPENQKHKNREDKLTVMKIIKQTTGTKLAIGIEGPRERAEILHNRVYNFGGTNGHLHELGDNFFYFLGEEREIFRALTQQIAQRISLLGEAKRFKKNPRAFCLHCMRRAATEMHGWTEENFRGNIAGGRNFHRVLDGGAPDFAPEFED
ncbi:MAG: hypothetical protein WC567_03895 [Kiritimatiellia bacterium]